MKFIDDITITNYKALQKMNFKCNSINVLVGPNNTGKSSILESIGFGISSLNDFKDIIGNNTLNTIKRHDIKYIIKDNTSENSCSEIKLKLCSKDEIDIKLEYCQTGMPEEEEEKQIFFEYINSLKFPDIEPISYRTFMYTDRILSTLSKINSIEGAQNDKKIQEFLYTMVNETENEVQNFKDKLINSDKLVLSSRSNNKLINIKMITDKPYSIHTGNISDNILIPMLVNKSDSGFTALYSKSFEEKKLSDAVNYLKERIPYFEEIREKDGILYVFLKDVKEPLPISLMGDGFKSLLKHSLMTTLIKNGIIIFEEPDITMHPGYLGVFADEIVNNIYNYQIFISTHSLELLKYLLNSADRVGKLNEISIIRLSRYNTGYIEREVVLGEDAKEEIDEIQSDLRGF